MLIVLGGDYMQPTDFELLLAFLEELIPIINIFYLFVGLILGIFVCVLWDFIVSKFFYHKHRKGEPDE